MDDESHIFKDSNPEAEIPYSAKTSHLWKRVALFQMIYSMTGLLAGLICIIIGMIPFINGYLGTSSITAKIIGSEININDTAPGGILFAVGLLVIYITKFNIKTIK